MSKLNNNMRIGLVFLTTNSLKSNCTINSENKNHNG